MINVNVKLIREHAILPKKQTEGSAGFDVFSCLTEDISIKPLERKLIPTGFSMDLPIGYEAQIRPRSGLAVKKGITVLNTPGTIDSDYRGEVGIILVNLSEENFIVTHGMRIAQMIITRLPEVKLSVVEELSETLRGVGGFGSTGV